MNLRSVLATLATMGGFATTMSANPIVSSPFTADPSGLVYHDTLWIFTGHDENFATTGFILNNWQLFSTADLVNYKSWGSPLGTANIPWSRGAAFAGDVREHNGKFYWYIPSLHKTIKVHEGFAIGVAVADHPTGPWTVLPNPLITDNSTNSVDLNIDPALFVDDDGTPWLYWGSWGAARRVKLKSNLTETTGPIETVNATGFFEAPWIYKFNGNYYFAYASGYPSTINYSMSTSLSGPWVSKGILNTKIPNSETNHEAIRRFGGHWLFIYHTANAPGGNTYRRSVSVDDMYYNPDGTIKQIVRSTTGPKKVDNSPLKPGVYRLSVKGSGLVLQDSGSKVVQATASTSDLQLWDVERLGAGRTYKLRNVKTGRYLVFPSTQQRAEAGTAAASNGIVIENFSVDDGYLLFADSAKDLVGGISDASKEVGKVMVVSNRAGTQNQAILFEPANPSGLASRGSNFEPIRILSASLKNGIQIDQVTRWELRNPSGTLLREGISDHIPTVGASAGLHLLITKAESLPILLR